MQIRFAVLRRLAGRATAFAALAFGALAALVLLSGRADSAPGAIAVTALDDLDQVRAALRKYEDPIVAIHDGYFSTLGCVEIPRPGGPGQMPYQPGGMGVHFLNLGFIGPVPDPAKPQILLYEPRGSRLVLTGAEWFVPLATGVTKRPVLFGQPFDGPMAGHHPLMPHELTHYDLHVWLFKPNPNGMFSATNPNVRCRGQTYRVVEEAPRIVPEPTP